MSLYFKELDLYQFRNHKEKSYKLSPHITILYGCNASGKTNTIEALQLLTAGNSFRKPSPRELIAIGCDNARIAGRLEGDDRLLDVQLDITNSKKYFTKNGKKCPSYEMARFLPSVLFNPDDLLFIKGSSSLRRSDIDHFACQVSQGYSDILRAYLKAIEQRNSLLKERYVDESLLDAWDEHIAIYGASLVIARRNLVRRLSSKMTDIYSSIASGERLICRYSPSGIEEFEDLTKEQCIDILRAKLKQTRPNDIRVRHTTIGPHRDDVVFEVDGMDSRLFCSQGQQRSIVLAWKMSQVYVCDDILDQKPLLLLDDVMSELDSSRRNAIIDFINNDIQTVITTTNLSYFSDNLLEFAKVIEYGS